MSRALILGGGFGGLSVATELRRLLGDDHEVVLIDRAERFAMGLRKLWELVGHATVAEGSRPRARLRARGIDVVRSEIRAIDPDARAAETDAGRLDGDHLVVARRAQSRARSSSRAARSTATTSGASRGSPLVELVRADAATLAPGHLVTAAGLQKLPDPSPCREHGGRVAPIGHACHCSPYG